MIALSATPIVGLPQFAGWSQVSENPPPSFARLACAFAVQGEQAGNVGRTIAEAIAEKTIASGQELFTFLTDVTEQVAAENCQLFFAAALITKTKTFFAARGGSILLKRNKKVGRVVQAGDDLHMVEGTHVADDTCVLLTEQGARFIDEIEQKMLQGYDTDSIITSIVPSIHAQEDSSLSAIAFVTERSESLHFEDIDRDSATIAIEVHTGDAEILDEPAPAGATQLAASPPAQSKTTQAARVLVGSFLRTLVMMCVRLWLAIVWVVSKVIELVMTVVMRKKAPAVESTSSPLLDKKKVYLTPLQKPTKLRIGIAFVLIALIVVGVISWNVQSFGRQSQAARASMEPFYLLIDQSRQNFAQDPLAVRQQVTEAIAQVEQREREAADDRAALPEIQKALASLRAYQEEISGQDELPELPVFYDLRLVSSDFIAVAVDGWEASLVADDGQLQPAPPDATEGQARAVFLDAGQNKAILLDLASKKVRLFDVSDVGAAKDIRLTDTQAVILADGLHAVTAAVESGEAPTPEEVIAPGDSNKTGTLLGAFGNYLYVFNPEKRNIYRYSQQSDGAYSDPIGWLQSTLGVQFEDVVGLSVDGDLWLTTKAGEVRKYTRGVAATFQIAGLPEPFTSPLQVATSPNSKLLYVLEPAHNRLVMINKADGAFVREVKSSSLASATGLFVSERLHKVFAVSGSIVFEVGL